MYLLIDMSGRDDIHLTLFDSDTIEYKNYSGRNRELLASIDNFFIEQKFDKKDLMGIMVVVGTGSFTSTRIACVVANSFAFVLQIPLLAIGQDKIDNAQSLISELLKQSEACPSMRRGQYISATYSGEPNIGKSQKQ